VQGVNTSMTPRTYDSTRRRAAAEGTRTQILEAARAILGASGDLGGFSVEAVAEQAGVARMTVYYQFHSRAQLLEALADHLAARGGMHRMREVFLEPDPEKALRRLVATFVAFWASDRVAMRRLRALGVVAPGQWGEARDRDAWRREAVVHLLAKFDRAGRPAGKTARRNQVDLLTSLLSFETFDALCTDERSPDAVTDLIAESALRVLGASPR
jgi:AcrR family transcriptional regulator